ncbi:MAG: hypothetical protein ACC726_01230 [Chloroflexota bacterium]
MRTTIDLPDDLYRTLKARAALDGTTMRELVQQFIESGLRLANTPAPRSTPRRDPPPVIIPASGIRIPALTVTELKQLEEDEDLAHLG